VTTPSPPLYGRFRHETEATAWGIGNRRRDCAQFASTTGAGRPPSSRGATDAVARWHARPAVRFRALRARLGTAPSARPRGAGVHRRRRACPRPRPFAVRLRDLGCASECGSPIQRRDIDPPDRQDPRPVRSARNAVTAPAAIRAQPFHVIVDYQGTWRHSARTGAIADPTGLQQRCRE
jgi:hypothetical protein